MSCQIIDGLITFPSETGGAVTQLTNVTTAVTLNAKGGVIIMQGAIPLGASAFTLNNSQIVPNSRILACCTNTRCLVTFAPVTVAVSAIVAGSCTITVNGDATNASAAAPIIQFIVI